MGLAKPEWRLQEVTHTSQVKPIRWPDARIPSKRANLAPREANDQAARLARREAGRSAIRSYSSLTTNADALRLQSFRTPLLGSDELPIRGHIIGEYGGDQS